MKKHAKYFVIWSVIFAICFIISLESFNFSPKTSAENILDASTDYGVGNYVTETFPDVPQNHWAYDDIMELVDRGIICGYDDGLFYPNDNISRSELSKIVAMAFNPQPNPKWLKAELVGDEWYYDYVQKAGAYISRIYANNFDGKLDANRLLVLKTLLNVLNPYYYGDSNSILGYEVSDNYRDELNEKFSDIDFMLARDIPFVWVAQNYDIVSGYPDGTFRWNKRITRAETAVLVNRVLKMAESENGIEMATKEPRFTSDEATVNGISLPITKESLRKELGEPKEKRIEPFKMDTTLEIWVYDGVGFTFWSVTGDRIVSFEITSKVDKSPRNIQIGDYMSGVMLWFPFLDNDGNYRGYDGYDEDGIFYGIPYHPTEPRYSQGRMVFTEENLHWWSSGHAELISEISFPSMTIEFEKGFVTKIIIQFMVI